MNGSVHIINTALATLSLYVWFCERLPFLDRHIQVVLDVVDPLHGLIANSPVGVRHRERLPEHLCVLACHELLFSNTDFLSKIEVHRLVSA